MARYIEHPNEREEYGARSRRVAWWHTIPAAAKRLSEWRIKFTSDCDPLWSEASAFQHSVLGGECCIQRESTFQTEIAYPSCPKTSPVKRKPNTGDAFTDLKIGITRTVAAKNVKKSRPRGRSTSSCRFVAWETPKHLLCLDTRRECWQRLLLPSLPCGQLNFGLHRKSALCLHKSECLTTEQDMTFWHHEI